MLIQERIDQLISLRDKGITEIFSPLYTFNELMDICYPSGYTGIILDKEEFSKFISMLDTVELDDLLIRVRQLHDEYCEKRVKDIPELGDFIQYKYEDVKGIVIGINTNVTNGTVFSGILSMVDTDGGINVYPTKNVTVIRKRSEILTSKE